MSKEEDQHVNVFVRVKPLSKREMSEGAMAVVQVASEREIIVNEQTHDKVTRKFTFDKVFSPASNQVDVYTTVVGPLLKEVLAGYNCTVFAYGQTSTGKTYTMEGDRVDDLNSNWQSDTYAGMIPRCLSHLFDELQQLDDQQYVVRVNFLELYNEELFDLLRPDGHDSAKIKLYEDTSRKGAVIIHGLEEVTVLNKAEVYKILEKGSERRQTAATLINANSSRSHTVFTITIHTKEDTDNGEELLKTAKLNLVDLAGSENVSKSGAINKRARETRNINQSLLTLGRVITALVEKAPHVPYRESKLTRLLQESLGGRTKTSIIATISSASNNVDETLSTLDYARRAKHITNRPEINQKLCKRALLKEYTEEVERLRKDLLATRKKDGIYLSQDKYNSMHELINWQRREIKKKIKELKLLEKDAQSKNKIVSDMQSQNDAQVDELTKKTYKLNDFMSSLQSTENSLKQVEDDRDEQKYLAEEYVKTEKILRSQIQTFLNVNDEALNDVQKLHNILDHKMKTEKENERLMSQMNNDFAERIKNVSDNLVIQTNANVNFFLSIKNEVENQIAAQIKSMKTSILPIMKNIIDEHFAAAIERSANDINISYEHYNKSLNKNMQDTSAVIEYERNLLSTICSKLAPSIDDLFKESGSVVRQNLQALNNSLSCKLDDVAMYANGVIETACKRRLSEFDSLRKDLSEISEYVNCMFLNEKQMAKNYNIFAQKIEALSHELQLLDKCEEKYSANVNLSHKIDKVCSKVRNQALQNYKADTSAYNNLEKTMHKSITRIKSDFNNNVKQIQVSSRTTIKKSNALASELKESLNAGCTTLKQYNNNTKFNAQQLQKRMTEDKSKLIASNATISKMLEGMDFTHIRLMKQQQNKISELSEEIEHKLIVQDTKLSDWNSKLVEQLRATQQKIDKFFTEDLRCDVVTDTIPLRKEFSYPNQFAMTPHKQLIEKFRQSQCRTNEMDNSNVTSVNKSTSSKRLSTPNVLTNSTATVINHTPYATSTPYKSSDDKQSNISLHSILTSKKIRFSVNSSKISTPTVNSKTKNHAEKNKENIRFG